MAVADVNGDGVPDVLVANYYDGSGTVSDGKISVLLGKGDGTFQPAQGFDSGGIGALSVAVADVNGDGRPDLVVSNDESTVGVLLGNGDGTFQRAMTQGSGGRTAYAVTVGDLNGGGKLDLVVADFYGPAGFTNSAVSALLGNGDGTFRPAVSTSVPLVNNFGGIAVEDFNGDGKLDVAISGGFVLLGNGDATFQNPLSLSSSGTGIAVGDFDGNGKPDLALGNVAVLLNITAGFHYATATTLTSSANPANAGQPVTFAATVLPAFTAGPPTGVITFYDGVHALSTVPIINGHARYTTSALTDGKHSITANYSGDDMYLESVSSILIQTITTPPVITTSADPTTLWPPNGEIVPVTISGAITDSGSGVDVSTATYAVVDEYEQVQPSGPITIGAGGDYSTTVWLQASRDGSDEDGRQYTITVSAKDNAGNLGSASIAVTVPHDQGQ